MRCKGVITSSYLSPQHAQPSTSDMSELEKLIKRATDETLTTDNWQYILDVCDNISKNPEVSTKAAIKIISARLALKDANIILRTLSLLVAVAENCGSRMRQEIASTVFLQDSLIKKLADRKLHKQVKFRVAEVIQQLNESFKTDPSLRPIADAYATVKSKYSQYLISPPDKPAKQQISQQDKQQEEKEMERALLLSVQEYEREQSLKKSYLNSKPLPVVETGNKQTQNSVASASNATRVPAQTEPKEDETATIASVKKVCALYDLISYEPDELSFKKGDIITVIESVYRDWWRGTLSNGKVGIFPLNYVTPVVSKSPAELSREFTLEARLMESELKKVDNLLALLSADPNTVDEDQVTQLYNEVIPLKANLAKFIDKYSTRKDELRAMHDQLTAESKMYLQFIDSIVTMRTQNQYAGTLPYPTGPGQDSRLSPAYPTSTGALEQQPTSAGFGNANFRQPAAQYQSSMPQAQAAAFNHEYVQQGSFSSAPPPTTFSRQDSLLNSNQEQYLHYSRFPDVNNI